MKIIKLKSSWMGKGTPVYVVVDKIEFVTNDGPTGSVVCMPSHNNGGLKVMESQSEIVRMMLNGPFVDPDKM